MHSNFRSVPRAPERGAVNRDQSLQPREAQRSRSRRPGILVVDDDANVRTLLGTALWHEGFTVWSACDGLEALQLYGQVRADIDLVLLDVRMPGLDGPQTLTSLQGQNPEIRCCFMSADLGDYGEEELLQRGAICVIHKPFRLAEIGLHLRRLVSCLVIEVPCGDARKEQRPSRCKACMARSVMVGMPKGRSFDGSLLFGM